MRHARAFSNYLSAWLGGKVFKQVNNFSVALLEKRTWQEVTLFQDSFLHTQALNDH